MNENTPVIFGVLFVFVIVGYAYYFLIGRKRMNAQLGIDQGDQMYRVYNAYVDVDVPPAKQAALLAVGLMFGSVASYRGAHLTVSLTKKGVLALGHVETGDGEVVRFTPDAKPGITIVGDGKITMSGWDKALEKTKIIEITSRNGDNYRLIVPQSGAQELVKWATH